MIFLKKIFSKFYAFFWNIINFLKKKKYVKIYKENNFLNDSSHFTDIKNRRLNSNNDICNHFDNLFNEVICLKPKFILELGVRK